MAKDRFSKFKPSMYKRNTVVDTGMKVPVKTINNLLSQKLNEWETKFLSSVLSNHKISQKQYDTIQDIKQKYAGKCVESVEVTKVYEVTEQVDNNTHYAPNFTHLLARLDVLTEEINYIRNQIAKCNI